MTARDRRPALRCQDASCDNNRNKIRAVFCAVGNCGMDVKISGVIAAGFVSLFSVAAAASDDALICADRPTKSNNACAVEAGAWQLETDLFNDTFQREGGVTTDAYLLTNPTLKYGVAENWDVEANLAPYEIVRSHDASGTHN